MHCRFFWRQNLLIAPIIPRINIVDLLDTRVQKFSNRTFYSQLRSTVMILCAVDFFFFINYEEENHRDRLLTTFVRIIHFPTDVGMNEIGYCFRILPFSCSNGSNCSSSYTRECMHACVNTESSCILRRPCARRANRRGNGWDARERGTSVFSV